MTRSRVYSAVQPTGNLHLGNYLGAIKGWVERQAEKQNFFCIVDLHAITVPQDADMLRNQTRGLAAMLFAAGLDVFEQEPALPDNPLFQLDNVVVSPHVAGADKLSQENMAIEAADCIIKLHSGEWPVGAVVNDDLRKNWKW